MRGRTLLALGVALTVAGFVGGGVVAALGNRPSRGLAAYGGMPGPMMGGGMMGGAWPGPGARTGPQFTLEQAAGAVQAYLARLGNPDLALGHLHEFELNFYATLRERSTGKGALELLVDKWSGVVFPEYGPSMMWNTKYGMMAGGPWRAGARRSAIGPAEARRIAQRWLDANRPGEVVEESQEFYGYYTLDTLRDGRMAGMLSVHGATRQVWYHTWHGAFIRERVQG